MLACLPLIHAFQYCFEIVAVLFCPPKILFILQNIISGSNSAENTVSLRVLEGFKRITNMEKEGTGSLRNNYCFFIVF
jgi:hypothetical protein